MYRLQVVLLSTLPAALLLIAGCSDESADPAVDAGTDTPSADAGSADTPREPENCFNTQDDNGDGLVDCDDPDCADDPACRAREVCDNGIDDDGDELVDCDDSDCSDFFACACPETVVEGLGYVEGETTAPGAIEGSCGGAAAPEATFAWTAPAAGRYTIDTFDSGFDTVLYVLDGATCGGAELGCNDDFRTSESCSVEGDEDGNGLADCDDPHCENSSSCVTDAPEDCVDEADNDGDDLVDCDDPDCGRDPSCMWSESVYYSRLTLDLAAGQEIVVVVDGWDAQSLGDVVLGFNEEPPSEESECGDDLDDDLDGLLDCADVDCAEAAACSGACPAEDLGSAIGEGVASGDTTEASRNLVGTCSAGGGGGPVNGGGRNAPDVAYQWTAPAAGEYTFDTVGSELDSVLYIRDGDCEGIELGCDDDIDAENEVYQSSLSVELSEGQTVVVVVDGWRYSEGTYTLNIAGPAE